jgi:hypothetical protein
MIMTADMTTLDGARVRRALRALQRSGCRLVQRRKDWAVVGASNSAIFATLTQADVAMLVAENLIAPAEGGGHVAASEDTDAKPSLEIVPRTGQWVFDAVGCTSRKPRGLGFAGLASRAHAGEGPLTLRQALAGLRLIEDAEQSLRGERTTMDWSGLVVDGQQRRARDGGLALAARRAKERIARVRADAGEALFALAWSACVERASIRSLARARGVKGREVQLRLSLALERLAAAYDGKKAYDEAEA